MSLLDQALKKAERAKQHHEADEHLAKPSEAFDEMLDLAPSPGAPHAPSAPGRSPFADEPPLCAMRLAPLESRIENESEDEPAPVRPAPPRAAVAAGPDGRTLRLLAMLGALLLVAAVFGFMIWRALYGPGSSRQLPMVPMPGQNAVAQASAPLISVAPPPDLSQPAASDTTPAFNAPPPTSAGVVTTPPPPPPLSDAEELRRIAQENMERAERMDRVLNMSNPTPRPPVGGAPASTATAAAPAYVAPVVAYASPVSAGAAPDNTPIRIARASKPEQVDPALQNAYGAFNAGDFASARQQYQAVLAREGANRDALLGMAALAVHDRQNEQAAAIYSRLLDIDGADGDAMAGLAGLRQADPVQNESRLRALLARAPESAPALFALGNLYARQGRWQEAQRQYFKAYSAAPGNADYAFNLAVGLDRLGQPKLALDYYRKALAAAPAGAAFDTGAASARIAQLAQHAQR